MTLDEFVMALRAKAENSPPEIPVFGPWHHWMIGLSQSAELWHLSAILSVHHSETKDWEELGRLVRAFGAPDLPMGGAKVLENPTRVLHWEWKRLPAEVVPRD